MIDINGLLSEAHDYCAARAAAAAGQSGLMALYDNLFGLMDLQAAQVLVTSNDFSETVFKENLCATVEDLISMNVVSSSDHDPVQCISEFDIFK